MSPHKIEITTFEDLTNGNAVYVDTRTGKIERVPQTIQQRIATLDLKDSVTQNPDGTFTHTLTP